MARGQDLTVALLSIHPEYALRILSGEKRVEFRRARFGVEPRFIVIYATHPLKRVVGAFEVAQIDEDTPERIWTRHSECGGISATAYAQYFAGRRRAFAIRIARVWQLRSSVPISEIPSVRAVPQSFQYLRTSELQTLLAAGTTPASASLPNRALQQTGRCAARS
jgi:predicted transcriptional regulator